MVLEKRGFDVHGSIASEEKKQAMTAESLSSQKVSKALFEASQGFTHSRFSEIESVH